MASQKSLYEMYKEAKISQAELCKRTKISHATMAKYLNKDYHGRFYDRINDALKAELKSQGLSTEKTLDGNMVIKKEKTNIGIVQQDDLNDSKFGDYYGKFNPVISDNKILKQAKENFNGKQKLPARTLYSKPKRGEIYYVYVGNNYDTDYNNERATNRPAIIIGNDKGNQMSTVVEVLYMTLNPKSNLDTHVAIEPISDYSTTESTVLCEQIHTVDKRRLVKYVSRVSDEKMKEINQALKLSLDLNKKSSVISQVSSNSNITSNDNNDILAYKQKVQLLETRLQELQEEIQQKNTLIAIAQAENSIYKKFFDAKVAKRNE